MVFLRAAHHLADHRVHHLALDQHRHGLVHLVPHHAPGELAVRAVRGLRGLAHFAASFAFWPRNVCTRAMRRRTRSISLFLVSAWVASCMRRPNCARRSSRSSWFSSSTLFERRSSFLLMVVLLSRSGAARTPS